MILIADIIGRSPSAVERLLGGPDKTEVILVNEHLPGLKANYHDGKVQVIYIDNIADWITVLDKEKESVEAFLGLLGIKFKKIKYKPSRILTYYKIHGMEQVKIHSNIEGKYLMLHIKAFTP
jgi:hypothetical protein